MELVYLSFAECKKIGDATLNKLAESLQNLPLIHEILLSFFGCPKVTSDGLGNLSNALRSMKELKRAEFNFKKCSIVDKDVADLEKSLKKGCESTIYHKLEKGEEEEHDCYECMLEENMQEWVA